ncbi:pyridoxal phosphate-dependent aminotransferase [Pseudonocardia sp. HH130630-07]|uniref:pyridoxal phosphate-dependent aminotransferase n=1 Tax=Pseudonocardia sp. HH130630-07 TaxID=1690815 RepID=UPI0008153BA1|nr:pyridoxal phosphate-dependent aminotransferase [Pseudonocardia sp. HH130630-07]ANY06333.1 aspartate aminotransferase [Pseudonocardia sp. HH130630-07]
MLERLPALSLAERGASRPDPVDLAGVPVLPMPDHVVEAVRRVAGVPFPRVSRGSPTLRAALATSIGAADPEHELLVTHGAQHGMSVALRALLEPGDEVLIPVPTYFFDGMVTMAGARPVHVRTRAEDGWAVDPAALEAAVTPATRALLLCNPNNPTGHTPDAAELGALVDLAARRGLVVLSDESYESYVHDGPGYVPLQHLRHRHPDLVTVTSLSKNYAFTHWRIGYVHAPRHLLDRVHTAFEWDAVNVGDIPQAAAEAVVTGPRDWLDAVFSGFRARRDLLVDVLGRAGIGVVRPTAGIFALADLGRLGAGRALEDLLLGRGIVALAGDAFGGPADHARLLYGGPEAGIAELGRRLG